MSRLDFAHSSGILIALLKQHEVPVSGMNTIKTSERLFLTTTSAMEVMLHTIAIISGADYRIACEGLETLGVKARLKQICEEMEKELYEIN